MKFIEMKFIEVIVEGAGAISESLGSFIPIVGKAFTILNIVEKHELKKINRDNERVIEDNKRKIKDNKRVIEDKDRKIKDNKRVIEDKDCMIKENERVILRVGTLAMVFFVVAIVLFSMNLLDQHVQSSASEPLTNEQQHDSKGPDFTQIDELYKACELGIDKNIFHQFVLNERYFILSLTQGVKNGLERQPDCLIYYINKPKVSPETLALLSKDEQ